MRFWLAAWLALWLSHAAAMNIDREWHGPKTLPNAMQFFSDQKGQYTLNDLIDNPEQAPWRPLANAELPRYDKTFYWFRLPLHNRSEQAAALLLVYSHPRQNLLNVYILADGKLIKRYETGSARPFDSRPLPHHHFLFPLDLAPGQHIEVLLQIHSRPAYIPDELALWQRDNYFLEVIGSERQWFFLGLLTAIVLYHVVVFGLTRDIAYLWYSLYIGANLVLFFSEMGYGFRWLWPDAPQLNALLPYLFPPLIGVTGTFFTINFLHLQQLRPRLTRFLWGLCIVLLGFVVLRLLLTAPSPLYVQAMSVALSLSIIINWGVAVDLWWRDKDHNARIYCIAWASLAVLFNGIVTLSDLEKVGRESDDYQLALVIHVILFALALANRINNLSKQQHLAKSESETQAELLQGMEAHMRPPLHAITALAQIPASSPPVKLIERISRRLLYRLDQAMDETALLRGRLTLQPQAFQLRPWLRQLLANVAPLHAPMPILYAALDPRLPEELVADQQRLQRLLVALLEDALEKQEQGEIALRFSLADPYTLLINLKTAVPQSPLSPAQKQLIEALSGDCGVHGQDHTELWLRWPLSRTAAATPPSTEEPPLRLLIVHRLRGYREALATTARNHGLLVNTAAHSSEALEKIKHSYEGDARYDWLVCESETPTGDAKELIATIRQHWPASTLRLLSLDAANQPLVCDDLLEQLQPPNEAKTPTEIQGARILLAAGNREQRQALRLMLQEMHCHVCMVSPGRELIHRYKRSRRSSELEFDCLLLDSPQDRQQLQQFERRQGLRPTPMLVLDQENGENADLSLPLSVRRLQQAIANVLPQPDAKPETALAQRWG